MLQSFRFRHKKCLGAVCHRTTIQRNFDQYETLRSAQEIDDPGQARNQDFMWGGANEAKVDQTTEIYFLLSIRL